MKKEAGNAEPSEQGTWTASTASTLTCQVWRLNPKYLAWTMTASTGFTTTDNVTGSKPTDTKP